MGTRCQFTETGLCDLSSRHFVLEIDEALRLALPDSRALTLYRDARPVIESMLRLSVGSLALWSPAGPLDLGRLGARIPRGPAAAALWWQLRGSSRRHELRELCPLLAEAPSRWIGGGAAGLGAALWASVLRRHQRLAGAEVAALRYEDLLHHPEAALRATLTHLGLPSEHAGRGLAALTHDSQSGTALARSEGPPVTLTRRERERIDELLQGVPEVGRPDVRLAGTIDVGGGDG